MRKPLVTIENWAVVQRGTNPIYGKLQPGRSLIGDVFGHATFLDTKRVYTSPILQIDSDDGLVETQNTIYHLGQASNEYKSWEQGHSPAAA